MLVNSEFGFFGRNGRDSVNDIRYLFGARLREIRLKKGVSQEALAFEAELHRTYISSVERGERNVSIVNIARIAAALDVPIRDFFPTK